MQHRLSSYDRHTCVTEQDSCVRTSHIMLVSQLISCVVDTSFIAFNVDTAKACVRHHTL